MYKKLPKKRYLKTLEFLKSVVPAPAILLDLGVKNPFTEILESNGYIVYNTQGEDLDIYPETVKNYKIDAVCAFEILEHLISPYMVLKNIECKKLVATVPLNLWFANAYKSKTDLWDRHFHEFEDWQFDWLIEKSGWEIKKRDKWTSPIKKVGIRPIFRSFTPRYYAIYAEKK